MDIIEYIKDCKNDAELMICENCKEANFYYKAQITAYDKILKFINKNN